MVLKLDPRIPMVWRSPWTLQFGVDPTRVVIHDISAAEEQLIAVLSAGISASGWVMTGTSLGASPRLMSNLLARLAPVMLEDSAGSPAPEPVRVDIVGTGPTVERISRILNESAQQVTVSYSEESPSTVASKTTPVHAVRCDLAVIVDHYVLQPHLYGHWLRRDIPHLPVIFGDTHVMIGPVIEPGTGPCLYCLDLHRVDNDRLWTTIAPQLLVRRSRIETPLVSREVAVIVARMVLGRVAGGVSTEATSVRLDTTTGSVDQRSEVPHPHCHCRDVSSAARPGNDWPREIDHGMHPPRPTTMRASSALE